MRDLDLLDLIKVGISKNASDLHVTVGMPPVFRIDGNLQKYGEGELKPKDTEKLVKSVLKEEQLQELREKGEIDLSFSSLGVGRFRVNVYKQLGNYGMALRIIPLTIPTMEELGVPSVVKELARAPRGLILVTGPTGSGKSTTLASIIDEINRERNCHILTLEDPIEYLHKHNKSIVSQREIGNDSLNFTNALRAALRQDPDVILVGEMRDLETIKIALTAAETGHLVISTLHTLGASKTIDRIIDVFPPYQQQQIRIQLASVIQGILSQQLLQKSEGSGRIAAFEVMVATPAIRNLIREEKVHQINTSIQTGGNYGMETMDNAILHLYNKGLISGEVALNHGYNVGLLKRYIQ